MSAKVIPFNWPRAALAGAAGGVAWNAGFAAFFLPAQGILGDPDLQSAKFIAVFATLEPLPRMAAAFWILPLGLFVLGFIYGVVYAVIARGLPGRNWLSRGLSFGIVAWALAFTWFEFYLPWNVMHEPAPLVLLELGLWLLVMLTVGLSAALAYRYDGLARKG